MATIACFDEQGKDDMERKNMHEGTGHVIVDERYSCTYSLLCLIG